MSRSPGGAGAGGRHRGPSVTSSAISLVMIIGPLPLKRIAQRVRLSSTVKVFPKLPAGRIIFLEHFISAYTERWLLLLGIIYILVVMFAPQGILGLTRSRTTKAG